MNHRWGDPFNPRGDDRCVLCKDARRVDVNEGFDSEECSGVPMVWLYMGEDIRKMERPRLEAVCRSLMMEAKRERSISEMAHRFLLRWRAQ